MAAFALVRAAKGNESLSDVPSQGPFASPGGRLMGY
jgi:hypothetical protein